MKDHEAMKQALANIKKLARQSVVDRYKAKKSKPAEAPSKPDPDAALELDEDEGDDLPEVEDEPDEAEEKTELIFMGRKPKPKAPEALEAPKKKRGRPPKQK